MSRLVRVLLLTATGLALSAASATACLNDRESAKSEKEFKSSYGDPAPSPPSDAPPYSTPTDRLLLYGGTGVGAALLLGGLTVTFLPRRRP